INSASFALTDGTATASAITTQPGGAVPGVAFTTQPVIRIVDSNGNTVSGSTVNVVATIASGTGTLSGTTTIAAIAGVATFTNLVISGASGNFTLTFTPTGLTAVTSDSFTVGAGAASALAISTNPSGAVSGTAFTTQPVVVVVDSGGNTVASSATISVSSSGGTLSGSTSVAAVNGVAAFGNLAITGSAGTYSLTFTSGGLSSVTSASFALTVPSVPSETEAVTAVLSPTIDNKIDVQIQGTSTTANLNISINIPKNSLTEETTVNVFSNSQIADIDSGFVSVRIESNRTSDNAEVTTFANAIEIRIPTTAVGASPAWSRDGLTWTLLPRLSEPVLPEGQADGYFVNADGSYSFFTRHLTTFGLMRTQAPLTLTSPNSGLKVHESVQLLFSGGTGSGAIMFKSKNPTVCSVSSGGIVSGLSIGECSVTASKLGWGSYLDATSAPTVFSISKIGLTNTFEGSTFSFKRRNGMTTIKVTMPMKYANKLIKIEWGVMKGGSVFYGSWGNTRANSAGVATLSTSKIITLKTFVKATLGSKIIAKRGTFANLTP
ncbi:MAG: hypothetical protein WC864_09810, partial [Ilumatobacteraceae bacterium]